eukprot:2526373-Rhodomonas_salina.2
MLMICISYTLSCSRQRVRVSNVEDLDHLQVVALILSVAFRSQQPHVGEIEHLRLLPEPHKREPARVLGGQSALSSSLGSRRPAPCAPWASRHTVLRSLPSTVRGINTAVTSCMGADADRPQQIPATEATAYL